MKRVYRPSQKVPSPFLCGDCCQPLPPDMGARLAGGETYICEHCGRKYPHRLDLSSKGGKVQQDEP